MMLLLGPNALTREELGTVKKLSKQKTKKTLKKKKTNYSRRNVRAYGLEINKTDLNVLKNALEKKKIDKSKKF